MKTTLQGLRTVLRENVCEIVFIRRRPKPGKPPMRRMLCTLDDRILNSENGRLALNYKPAGGPMPYNTDAKNLLPVWDIFMQDYRCINMIACDLIQVIPANKTFWTFFNEKLAGLSAPQKVSFMNS